MTTVPTPSQAAALRQLGLLRSDELPLIAAHLLINLDTPALRQLAGLAGSDTWLIDRVWPEALDELGVADLDSQQAWKIAVVFLVDALHAGDRSAEEVLRAVARFFVENGYPSWAPEASHIYGLEDELDGRWGRTRDAVLADAVEVLAELADRVGQDD